MVFTHLGMVLSFPCKILCVLALLSATDTPDELNVIHSIAAEPPNNGAENKGALAKTIKESEQIFVLA